MFPLVICLWVNLVAYQSELLSKDQESYIEHNCAHPASIFAPSNLLPDTVRII